MEWYQTKQLYEKKDRVIGFKYKTGMILRMH
jgi:hypothetical protein